MGDSSVSVSRWSNDRFLASVDEDSDSDNECLRAEASGMGPHSTPRLFCGAIWGRVHSMTYEIIDESRSPREQDGGAVSSAAVAEDVTMFVPSDFDSLVQCHGRVLNAIRNVQSSPQLGNASASPPDESDALASKLSPRSSGSKDSCGEDSLLTTNHEVLTSMLQLISAFHNIALYLRVAQSETDVMPPVVEEEHFHCNALTS